MKLNMGCGHNKQQGYVNVDLSAACKPDVVWDLEQFPWPWHDNSAEVVRFVHSLEHIGENSKTFLRIIQELYRICKNGAHIEIRVPHPRHNDFLNDPTHVRTITPDMFTLFDRQLNDHFKKAGWSNTTLAHYLDVDFVLESHQAILCEPYSTQLRDGTITQGDVEAMARELNNIASEYHINLRVRKV
jgi:hypothetical protein